MLILGVLALLGFSLATRIEMKGIQLYVDGALFPIRGVCYSPVPSGEGPMYIPFGDYFTDDYAYIWKRDLPMIKKMGANIIRIYGWNSQRDHTIFLDEVYKNDLYAFVTYFVPDGHDLDYADDRIAGEVIGNFSAQVEKYASHPAVLIWSFGNELNGPWNGLMSDFNIKGNCNWDQTNCWYNDHAPDYCWAANRCIYEGLFGFINEAAREAKQHTNQLMTSGMADLDLLVFENVNYSKIHLYADLVPDLDMWALQIYRGSSFGTYFDSYAMNSANSPKPLIVTEYGVDAYNDPCGWPGNDDFGWTCFNLPNDGVGGPYAIPGQPYVGCTSTDPAFDCARPGAIVQADWDTWLTIELMDNFPTEPNCSGVVTESMRLSSPYSETGSYGSCTNDIAYIKQHWEGNSTYIDGGVDGTDCSIQRYLAAHGQKCPMPEDSNGAVLGGFLMAWQDEFWKGFATQAYCQWPCDPSTDDSVAECLNRQQDFWYGGGAVCNWKSHFTCSNQDFSWHGLCGYFLGAFPDLYVNEEWFGVMVPETCGFSDMYGGHKVDFLQPRDVYYAMQLLWTGQRDNVTVLTCDEMKPCYDCLLYYIDSPNAVNVQCQSICDFGTPTRPTSQSPTTSVPTFPTYPPWPSSPPTSPPPTTLTPTPAPTPPTAAPSEADVDKRAVVMLDMPLDAIVVIEEFAEQFAIDLASATNTDAGRFTEISTESADDTHTHVLFTITRCSSCGETDNLQASLTSQSQQYTASAIFLILKAQMDDASLGLPAAINDGQITQYLNMTYGVRTYSPPASDDDSANFWRDNEQILMIAAGGAAAVGLAAIIVACVCRKGSSSKRNRQKSDLMAPLVEDDDMKKSNSSPLMTL